MFLYFQGMDIVSSLVQNRRSTRDTVIAMYHVRAPFSRLRNTSFSFARCRRSPLTAPAMGAAVHLHINISKKCICI